jgi:3-phosphoshikimate 1-carboxyvinyltransferase
MKHNIILTKKSKSVKGIVHLTGSKSECNRALIIEALSNGKVKVENISDAADAVTLASILRSEVGGQRSEVRGQSLVIEDVNSDFRLPTSDLRLPTSDFRLPTSDFRPPISEINIGPAGTAMRFLTAYFALQPAGRTGGDEEVILTGSERMKQRPIGILVNALRELGADIEYVENVGFPPIKIKGSLAQTTSKISIKGNISSQYITALLLIAARLPSGLELHIEGELTSRPYVEMTLAMLQSAGIKHTWDDNVIAISHQQFASASLHIEPDWSAASYWYAIAALADQAELFLPGLTQYSLQGDSVITEIMANFGITSQFKDGGVYLQKEAKPVIRKIFDLKECPDLAQTIIVVCAALGHEATFTGLETLKIKETDRIKALQNELAKIGVKLIEKGQVYKLDCSEKFMPERIFVNTYDDHRMAMAFAPLALIIPEVEIEDANVVEKSYPAFWSDLEKVGFEEEAKAER